MGYSGVSTFSLLMICINTHLDGFCYSSMFHWSLEELLYRMQFDSNLSVMFQLNRGTGFVGRWRTPVTIDHRHVSDRLVVGNVRLKTEQRIVAMLLTVMEQKSPPRWHWMSIEGSSLASRFGGIAVFGKISYPMWFGVASRDGDYYCLRGPLAIVIV